MKVSKSYLSPVDTANTALKSLDRSNSNHNDIGRKDVYRTDSQSKSDIALDNHKTAGSAETVSICSQARDSPSNVLDGCKVIHPENSSFPMEELKGHVSILSNRIDKLEQRLTNDIKTILLLLQEQAARQDPTARLAMAEPLAERNSHV